jgi:2-oxoisovalerate dehydrogenase E1 component
VFGFTKGCRPEYPDRVRNAPLAEATIVAPASGSRPQACGPIVELQFIDFAAPALNQIANQLATLRWRSGGGVDRAGVLYAPHGAYLPAGAHGTARATRLVDTSPGSASRCPDAGRRGGDVVDRAHERDPTLF